jgi:hypothetical protein
MAAAHRTARMLAATGFDCQCDCLRRHRTPGASRGMRRVRASGICELMFDRKGEIIRAVPAGGRAAILSNPPLVCPTPSDPEP